MHSAWVVFIFIASDLSIGFALKCFECSDIPHPQDCPTITTCSSGEKCYVEQYVTSGGLVLYNSGCLSNERCVSAGKRATFFNAVLKRRAASKRQQQVSNTDIPVCVECCDSEMCNVEGCRTQAVERKDRGPRCFSCLAQNDPENCRDVKLCDKHQVCSIMSIINEGRQEWKTDCMGEIPCQVITGMPFMGKRDTAVVNQCPRCCTDDFCNHSCRHNVTLAATTQSTTLIVPTHQHVVHSTPQASNTILPSANQHSHSASIHSTTAVPQPPHQSTKAVVVTTVPHQHSHNVNHNVTTVLSTAATKPHHASTTVVTVPPQHSHIVHQNVTTASITATTKPHHESTTVITVPPQHSHVVHQQATTLSTAKPHQNVVTTVATPQKPTTDPAIGCTLDKYVYDPPTNLCLRFYETLKLNWTEAQDVCNQSKGQLAIITGDQKIKDVLQFYKDDGYTTPMWVGATDLGNGHVFTFTDGSTLTIDPATGQDLTTANCLYISGGSYKRYGPCTEKHGFICERKANIRA